MLIKFLRKLLPKTKNITPAQERAEAEARVRLLENRVLTLQRRSK